MPFKVHLRTITSCVKFFFLYHHNPWIIATNKVSRIWWAIEMKYRLRVKLSAARGSSNEFWFEAEISVLCMSAITVNAQFRTVRTDEMREDCFNAYVILVTNRYYSRFSVNKTLFRVLKRESWRRNKLQRSIGPNRSPS